MANRNSNYWRKRSLQLEDALNKKGIEYYHDLERLYKKAAIETEKEISKLYSRLVSNNGITLSEAKKLLTSNELEEFRWSVQEYIKYGKKNKVDQLWTKQLENASLKYRISRLEATKIHMQQQVEVLMGNELDSFSKVMTDIYTESYYRNAHIIQTGLGVGHSFASLDANKIEKVLSKPWVGNKNFSQRIWGDHRTKLVNELHTVLTQSIIRGESPDKAIKTIAKRFDVAKHRAGNLVMTESAYFGTKAQQDCYKELDVEMQEFVATLDNHTSDICQAMDGKVFKTSEIEIGVNAPPLHGRCRSVLVPYFEDNITERAARDEDGKTVYIKGNMKYEDWKKKFVDGEESTFTPAKTLEEAKAYTDKFVKGDGKATWGKASNLDNINEFNKTLEHLTTKYGESDFDTIGYAPRGNFLAHANGQIIEAQAKFINGDKKHMKDLFDESVTNFKSNRLNAIKSYNENYLDNPAYNQAKVKKAIKTWEKDLDYSRFNAFTSPETMVRDVITHEYGHSLMFRAIKKEIEAAPKRTLSYGSQTRLVPSITKNETKAWKAVDDAYRKAIKTKDIHKISKYASTEPDEFFAETFAMRENGEDLPDYIESMLKEVTGK